MKTGKQKFSENLLETRHKEILQRIKGKAK